MILLLSSLLRTNQLIVQESIHTAAIVLNSYTTNRFDLLIVRVFAHERQVFSRNFKSKSRSHAYYYSDLLNINSIVIFILKTTYYSDTQVNNIYASIENNYVRGQRMTFYYEEFSYGPLVTMKIVGKFIYNNSND